jgi:hypothetical protein
MSQLIRMVVAYTCLVLVTAFVALWVASYFFLVSVSWRLNSDERVGMGGERGQLNWSWHYWTPGEVTYPIYWRVMPIEDHDRMMNRMMPRKRIWPPEPSLIGFGTWRSDRESFYVVMPHWFPILLIGAIGIIAKPRPKLTLGIRDLLILTTLLAIVMTVVVTSDGRAWPRR